MTPSESTESTVLLVDDDEAVQRGLGRLIRTAGYSVATYRSAQEFLAAEPPESPACIVLDVQLPGLSGLDLQELLREAELPLSIVFITGHGDIPMSVRAMKKGAVDFLPKPVDEEQLFAAIEEGLRRDRESRSRHEVVEELTRRAERLTPREREVFELVVQGLLNKQIALELGTAEKTIKVHRGRVMRKMEANSVTDLVRFFEILQTSGK